MNGMRHRLPKKFVQCGNPKRNTASAFPPAFHMATRNRRVIQSNGLLTNLSMMQYGRFTPCALRGVVRLKLQGSWKKKFYCQPLIMNPSGESFAESLRTIYLVGIRKLLPTLKVQNTIYKPKEEHQVIPDMQETIVFENKRPDRLYYGSRPWKLKGSIPLFSLQSGSACTAVDAKSKEV